MTQHNFTIKELFNSAWQATKKNAWYLFTIFFIAGLILSIGSLTPLGGFVQILVGISIVTISLVIVSGNMPTYEDTIKSFKTYKIAWHYLLATLLYALIVVVGIILLIIPGIYLAVRLQFYKFIVIDNENMGPVNALKKSMDITRGHFWKLLGFMITLGLFNLLGLLFFVVGLIVTIPVSVLAMAFLYKKLSSPTHEPHAEHHVAA